MKYYRLGISVDLEEIGKYPQSIASNKNMFEVNKIKWYGKEGIIDNFHILPEPVLYPKSKETTFISIQISFLVLLTFKKLVLDFLNEFNISSYQKWDIKVGHNNRTINDYCLFRLQNSSQEKYVDYKKSEFLIGKIGDLKDVSSRKPVKVKDYQNYLSLIEILREENNKSGIRCHKLVLNLSDVNEDMFRLINMPYFGNGYYVSEKLKYAMEVEGFTGMRFEEIEQVDKRIEVIY